MVIEADFDDESAQRALRNMERKVPDDADDLAKELAEEGARRMRRNLQRQGSVSSGRSMRRLRAVRNGFGRWSIVGPKYLEFVDEGTQPHWPPYQSSNRFENWAVSHGMAPKQLAKSIALKGTQPHPFIARSLLPIIRAADDRAIQKLDDTVEQS